LESTKTDKMLKLFLISTVIVTALGATENNRDARLFGLISLAQEPCATTSTEYPRGTCFARLQCPKLGGTAAGTCVHGLGNCCYFTKTCDGTVSINETSFINTNYPNKDSSKSNCKVNVKLLNRNICQLRLDFDKFELNQPTTEGLCTDAFLRVSKTLDDRKIPLICGLNNAQHVYVDVDPKINPEIQVDTSKSGSRWNIRISQIECTSKQRAPSGCLQYYRDTNAIIKSFNFQSHKVPEIKAGDVSVHLQNLNYAICIKPQSGYCNTVFQPVDETSFIMTGDAKGDENDDIGKESGLTPEPFDSKNPCKDYLVIPGASYTTSSSSSSGGERDRYCRLTFPKVTSTAASPIIHVHTDLKEADTENKDTNNVGFQIKYRMNPCT